MKPRIIQKTSTIKATTPSLDASSPSTTGSKRQVVYEKSHSSIIVWAAEAFTQQRASNIDNEFEDIDEYVARIEKDPAEREGLARARMNLAKSRIGSERINPLARLRMERGLSQVDLSKLAKTSQSHIARIELGEVDPRLSTVRKIAKALNVSVAEVDQIVEVDETPE